MEDFNIILQPPPVVKYSWSPWEKTSRGLQGDGHYLSWPIAPLVYEPKCKGGRGRDCGVSANENSRAHHVTWSPNEHWRSNSIFNLWKKDRREKWQNWPTFPNPLFCEEATTQPKCTPPPGRPRKKPESKFLNFWWVQSRFQGINSASLVAWRAGSTTLILLGSWPPEVV